MEQKIYRGQMRLKEGSDATGQFEAVFATLKVRDLDGDVTLPGAFTEGQETPVAHYGHDHHSLPPGRGAIHERDGKALMEGEFFLDTITGKEHYTTIKRMGGLQEWSYAFDVVEQENGDFEGQKVRFLKKLDVHEVAPVMKGAGIGTETVAIKSDKAVTRSEADGQHPAGHYLVIEDPEKPSTWHLRVRNASGELDHRLMGAGWAALHAGYRGNVYQGPGKREAIAKLTRLYEQEGMDVPKADWDGETKGEGTSPPAPLPKKDSGEGSEGGAKPSGEASRLAVGIMLDVIEYDFEEVQGEH